MVDILWDTTMKWIWKKAKTFYNFGVKEAVDEFCLTYNQSIEAKAYDGCVSFCINIKK